MTASDAIKGKPHTLRSIAAYGVHLFTATGAVWGLLSILAILDGNYKLLFVWIIMAGSRGRCVCARYVFPRLSPFLSSGLPDTVAFGTKPPEEKAVAAGLGGEGFQARGFPGLSSASAWEGLWNGARRIPDFIASNCSTFQRW